MNRWRLSAGTAWLLGLQSGSCDVPPTTGYIMLGEHCRNNCAFCAQAAQSGARKNQLSRIVWPECVAEQATELLKKAHNEGAVRRTCFQVVNEAGSRTATLAALRLLGGEQGMPLCVSGIMNNVDEAKELFAAGAERICIALDAATEAVYRLAKGSDWQKKRSLLAECATHFPGRITTHLIVGLGESEEEMVDALAECCRLGITAALFAFTPLRGTRWAQRKAPELGQYRRCQIARRLLYSGLPRSAIQCANGRIIGIDRPLDEWRKRLADGSAFQTSGCPDCNRPYYNERPGHVPFNYPRALSAEEVRAAVAASGLCGRDAEDEMAGCL